MNLTAKDEALIELLREDGRMSVSEIGRRLAVSRTAAQMRLQKLERNGIIDGYSVRLSRAFLNTRVSALVMIKFPPAKREGIERELSAMAGLSLLYSISGPFDLAALISAPSMVELDAAIDKIGHLEAIDETMSSIILSTKIDR